jgi:hypothetical protein
MKQKHCLTVVNGFEAVTDYDWFAKFYNHCAGIAEQNGWHTDAVVNRELKPYGRLIKTKTQGWYIRFDDEKYHLLFVIKWS